MQEALRAYTLGSYQACQRSDELGTLEVGKLADVVVLDTNILTNEPESILITKVF